jgi:hypothetical protein
MAVGVVPATIAQMASRLVVGTGEGLMMSAAVLWPLLADAAGGFEPVLVLAAALPLLAVAVMPRTAPPAAHRERDGAGLLAATLRPGLGLMLVNIGYAATLAFCGDRSPLVVPAFALTVIAARTLGAGIPDRFGARATVWRPGCSSPGSMREWGWAALQRAFSPRSADRPVRLQGPPSRSPARPRWPYFRPAGREAAP